MAAKTALVLAVVVVLIAVVAAILLAPRPTAQQTQPPATTQPTSTSQQTPTSPSPTPPPTTTSSPAQNPSIQYDAQLAQKGIDYFKSVGCTACHSVKSLGISGGAVGPDLSKALTSPSTAVQGLARFYKENGLENPAADPQKAAQLLAQFLTNPPSYSTTMSSQVNAYKSLYGDQWEKDYVPALLEMMKMAAAK